MLQWQLNFGILCVNKEAEQIAVITLNKERRVGHLISSQAVYTWLPFPLSIQACRPHGNCVAWP